MRLLCSEYRKVRAEFSAVGKAEFLAGFSCTFFVYNMASLGPPITSINPYS